MIYRHALTCLDEKLQRLKSQNNRPNAALVTGYFERPLTENPWLSYYPETL